MFGLGIIVGMVILAGVAWYLADNEDLIAALDADASYEERVKFVQQVADTMGVTVTIPSEYVDEMAE